MQFIRFCASGILALWAAVSAYADGAFFLSRVAEGRAAVLSQTRQEVMLAFYTGANDSAARATYVLRSRYTGQPVEVAWVIPVPATPTDVMAHSSAALFDYLAEQTTPRFTIEWSPEGIFGCGCAAPSTMGERTVLVEVESQGQAGIYDWAALTSTGSDALLTWLNDHSFTVPATAAHILDRYIQQDMHFLAIRVREPEKVEAGTGGEIETPPIQFTCQTERRFYPIAISQISAAEETEVVIYVLADHRAEAANLPNGEVDRRALAHAPLAPSETNYEELFRQTIEELGGTALITEAALPEASWNHVWLTAPTEVRQLTFLTRLRTLIARNRMDMDFEFRDAATDTVVPSNFWLNPDEPYAWSVGGATLIVTSILLGRVALMRSIRYARGW